MNEIIRSQLSRIALVSSVLVLAACSGGSGEPAKDGTNAAETFITDDTPFVYIERNTAKSIEQSAQKLSAKLVDENSTPLDVYSPYDFSPGANLVRRSSLDVNGVNSDVLREYFGGDTYDVKDLNVSYDGTKVLFAAHGPVGHTTDNSWNIYEYSFATGLVSRIIADDVIANSGQDTNPAYAENGMVVFSSDRAAGNPNNPLLNQVPEDKPDCYKVGANERPSLLHSMTAEGKDIVQITYGNHHDTKPASLKDGRVAFLRWKRSYEFVRECAGEGGASSLQKLSAAQLFKSEYPEGLTAPETWDAPEQCAYAQQTPFGPVLATNHYTLLRIKADGTELEQLYKTVTTRNSEESLLHLEEIVQSESGRLVALLKHRYNNFLGGNVMELMEPSQNENDKVFASMAMKPVISDEVSLFPNQVSMAGWFSAVAPYRDGSSRLLVSWSQCKTSEGGISDFCSGDDSAQNVDSAYGIWVYDPVGDSRLPIVRAKSGVEYTEIALSQPHSGADFPFTAFEPDYGPDVDDSRIICDDPSYVEPSPVPTAAPTPVEPTDEPTQPTDEPVQPTNEPVQPTDEPVQPTDEPVQPTDEPVQPTDEPVQPTDEPVQPTDEPVQPTDEPVQPTDEPVQPTDEPVQPTDEPVQPTDEPVQPTDEPVQPTDEPVQPTDEPVEPTDEPVQPTDEPVEPTDEPVEPTDEPVQPTDEPVEPTDEPVQPSDEPVEPSDEPNQAPIADAGEDQPVKIGVEATLDGSASSDADGDALSYAWRVVSPVGAVLSDPRAVMPKLVPSAHTTYEIELVVNDGKVDSEPDYVLLVVGNTAPVADAGEDQATTPGSIVTLDGSDSYDLDDDQLTYSWALIDAPADASVQLSDSSAVLPTFEASHAGSYTFSLVVNDGIDDSNVDTVTINTINSVPVADAGDDQSVEVGNVANLDGSDSFDADGDALSYRWSLSTKPDGSNATISDDASVTPMISIDKAGVYIAQLIVSDGIDDSAPDSVIVTTANVRPIAKAGADDNAKTGETVVLDGSQSYDPDGDNITYHWNITSQPEDSNVSLDSTSAVRPSLTLTHVGTYVMQLVVSDGELDSAPDSVKVVIDSQPQDCVVTGNSRTFPVVIRDFKQSHPDFEYKVVDDRGIVEMNLGADNKPVYAHGNRGTASTNGPDSFVQWYNNVQGVNLAIDKTLTMNRSGDSNVWTYENNSFFPIDNEGWGNTPKASHNYHFTLETHLEFNYEGGEVFTFRGDDDLWLYINGILVIDIGGVHEAQEQSVDLDAIASRIGIEPGNTYSFDLFFAERHTVKSNFMFQTNIKLECVPE